MSEARPFICLFNLASNTLVNQHADINPTIQILQDEKLVECIVVSGHFMTPSAKFADVLLPADNSLERSDFGFPWSGEKYIVFGNKVVEPPGECRNEYWWLSRVAQKLGVGEKFTEGKSREDWLKESVTEAQKSNPALPNYEALKLAGLYREPPQPYSTGQPFRRVEPCALWVWRSFLLPPLACSHRCSVWGVRSLPGNRSSTWANRDLASRFS